MAFKRKISYTILCQPCWDTIPEEHCLVKVVQIYLRQHCTRKLLAQCWLRAHRHNFAGKSVAVSNMSNSLSFNQEQYHNCFCLMLALDFIYGLQDNKQQVLTSLSMQLLYYLLSICSYSHFLSNFSYVSTFSSRFFQIAASCWFQACHAIRLFQLKMVL